MLIISTGTLAKGSDLTIDQAPIPVFRGRALRFDGLPLFDQLRIVVERAGFRYAGICGLACASLIAAPRHPAIYALAPFLVFMGVLLVEGLALSRSYERRRALMDAETARAVVRRFTERAETALAEIADRNGITSGALHLVVEQSALDRLRPLTVLSVQRDVPNAEVVDLSARDRLDLACLFDETLSEDTLSRAQLSLDRTSLTVAVLRRSPAVRKTGRLPRRRVA